MLNLLSKPKLFACSTSGIVYDNEVVVLKQVLKNNTDKLKLNIVFVSSEKGLL